MKHKLGFQWKSRQLQVLFVISICVWALLAIILAFTDLSISIAIVDYNSQWAKAISSYGEIPGYILISISLIIILRDLWIKSGWIKNPIFWVIFLCNILVIILLLGDLLPESLLDDIGEEVLVFVVIIIEILIIVGSKKIEELSQRKAMDFAWMSFYLALIIPLLYTQLIKQLWGRIRFRDLVTDFTDFTPWFQPQGITGNYSFPSGHTAMGWMLLPILILISDKKNWPYKIIGGVVFIWGVIVALGRIVIGAHYASDVVFSTGGAFITFIILYNHYSSQTINKEI